MRCDPKEDGFTLVAESRLESSAMRRWAARPIACRREWAVCELAQLTVEFGGKPEAHAAPLGRTIRVPAIGQRVRDTHGREGCMSGIQSHGNGSWIASVVLAGDPPKLEHFRAASPTPIGPEPHRWIAIELPGEPEGGGPC